MTKSRLPLSSVEAHTTATVMRWLRGCRTLAELSLMWGQLSPASQNLNGVAVLKDELKGRMR